MAPWLCRATFQRAVGKIFYHAGFEDFQPAALDAATDIASDFFTKLIRTFTTYREAPREEPEVSRFTAEDQVLHCLHKNGMDLEALETYVKDDVERLNSKLVIVHERMKAHLADLLVSPFFFVCFTCLPTDDISDPLWAIALAQTAQVHSTMGATSLSEVISPKTLTRTSSASKNSDWLPNSDWRHSAFRYTCSKTACIAPIKPTIQLPCLPLVWFSRRLPLTSQSAQRTWHLRLDWCKTSLQPNLLRTKADH